MKTFNRLTTFNALLLTISFLVFGSSSILCQISVIVSKSSTQSLTKNEVKEIFSGTQTTWTNGKKVLVIDQSDSEAGSKFYNGFLSKSVNKVRLQWTKLVLSGIAIAPVKASNDDEVKRNVVKDPNNVGYIDSKSLDASVKELFRIE